MLGSHLPEHPDSTPRDSGREPVVVARVLGPHGRDGGLRIQILSDLPGRFGLGRVLLVGQSPHPVSAFRQTGPDSALLWLEGVVTRRQAVPLTGQHLAAVPDSDVVLEEGEYFHYQLIGMRVRTEEGEDLGEIQEILETGSNDVYIVRGDGGEVLIPATAQVVRQVDLAANAMLVRLPGGLR